MRTEEKNEVKNGVGRLTFVALAVLIQLVWIVVLVLELQKYSLGISIFTTAIAVLVVLHIYGKHTNAAFKMPWIMLILVFPIFGLVLYVLTGNSGLTRRKRKVFEEVDTKLKGMLSQDPLVMQNLRSADKAVANQSHYIQKYAHYPVYDDTHVDYYGDTCDALRAQQEALKTAEHFIFMEYHAIEDSTAFQSLHAILKERAAHGVEVRILYDEMGSIGFIDRDFIRKMQADGIQCRVFNPLVPLLSVFMNHRDHRKVTVVDGRVGFTGGYNMADEYFNITHPYGQWKDTGIRLEGEAVRSLTQIFLEMWNAVDCTDTQYEKYLADHTSYFEAAGYVQPYADNPLDGELVGENVYLNLIKNAKDYIYFTTPYLIISDEMNRELGLAAKRGVDVRIITPGIPDKKLVFKITRSYYAQLVSQGVRIYEYTPGFMHAKQSVSDDCIATVGTINMDWRSLYMHFENGTLLYNCDCIADIKQDFLNTFELCQDVTNHYAGVRSTALRIKQCLLRLISPLM